MKYLNFLRCLFKGHKEEKTFKKTQNNPRFTYITEYKGCCYCECKLSEKISIKFIKK